MSNDKLYNPSNISIPVQDSKLCNIVAARVDFPLPKHIQKVDKMKTA